MPWTAVLCLPAKEEQQGLCEESGEVKCSAGVGAEHRSDRRECKTGQCGGWKCLQRRSALRPRLEFTSSPGKAPADKRNWMRGFPEKVVLHRKAASRPSKASTSKYEHSVKRTPWKQHPVWKPNPRE